MTALKGRNMIPAFIYGTAWKKERSHDLVRQAINAGFRAIDTAAQPKHYSEDLVGAGVRDGLKDTSLKREDLWVQTKFTPINGQDKRMPYDPQSSIPEQVEASLASSFQNFAAAATVDDEDYLDAVLMHSPYADPAQTLQAWQTMSKYVPSKIRQLGISNVTPQQLRALYSGADTPPTIVQNSFHAGNGYDAQVREFCREQGIIYQSFWTLTANPHLLRGETVQKLATNAGVSAEVSLYSLVILGLDVRVLNGTTNTSRMAQDLKELDIVRAWRQDNRGEWMKLVSAFKGSLARGRTL